MEGGGESGGVLVTGSITHDDEPREFAARLRQIGPCLYELPSAGLLDHNGHPFVGTSDLLPWLSRQPLSAWSPRYLGATLRAFNRR